ncbi:hypothetical protein B0T26DRAFT_638923 [Lasiosphaeria miniovina]|uniref:leucine--tRNA ligase n=1 Tax=Lasiosphaeria miniovina TaxID=1954250 RepID=A0AA40B441_9PEZI|nr:uncharacterized protein B0T26DRAFT_638923 [Lasiosphaeria miniovina]KAK0727349.1 hypothetical protein B0T26DRAFT_638923 [Lasiosphaeria miniovina]
MPLIYGRSIGRLLPKLGGSVHFRPASNPCASTFRPRGRSAIALQALDSTLRRGYAESRLDLPALDQKWRQKWASLQADSARRASDTNDNKYILPMFPYPSGTLHMGHLRVYTIADVVARFHSLKGNNVLLPMGWDAFGLPAENAAIERGINPATWTKANIAKMKEQLDVMNGSWDWSRELATCDPSFYKHTQAIFLRLHEKGLAYQAEAEVNYDPVDKTVLANEQVDANGRSWRSGAKVEKKNLRQWFLRISHYRDSLLRDLEVLEKEGDWPERVLAMQKNWLGKSAGAQIKFPVLAFGKYAHARIEIFTSRPDTLFGVQYLALASTHPIATALAEIDSELQAFLDTLPGLPPDSKVGYLLPNLRAVNPLAYHDETPEATKKSLPVYVAPYVVGDYGEGAVMGVPGHDVHDHAFWKTHRYDEPVRIVLAASEDESTTALPNESFVDRGILTEQSGIYKGKPSKEAGEMLVSLLEPAGLAKSAEKWRLRDWLISRQRYWGTPIPIIHCGSCGSVPVPHEDLPVLLPEVDDHWAAGKSGNPLESLKEWAETECPKCGGQAKRDTDTMDTFVDSSWYYMRFIDPQNEDAPFSASKAKALLPVDIYIGGVEHAILHLLYARFIYKFLMTSPLVSDGSEASSDTYEPFKRLVTQGMVNGKTYSDPSSGRFLKLDEVDLSIASNPKVVATGESAVVSFEKMSKSKYNGVDPTEFISQYGADATRAHMLFQAPVSEVLDWDGEKIVGITRWFGRIYDLVTRLGAVTPPKAGRMTTKAYFESAAKKLDSTPEKMAQWDADSAIWRDVQKIITSVSASYEKVYTLNTVVSDLMILTNTIMASDGANAYVKQEAVSALLRMVAPVAPAFAEECWSVLKPTSSSIFGGGTASTSFPALDGTLHLFQPRKQVCAVQVNGKLRCAVEIPKPPGLQGDELRDWLLAEIMKTDESKAKLMPTIAASGSGVSDVVASAKKIIVIKGGKLVNFVF